jgi:riboflavin kinase/FMN adenylyltransferase
MSEGVRGMIFVSRSVEEIPPEFGPSVGAIGNFDGVHQGHRKILEAVAAEARGSGFRAVAITFDPHPDRFLRPAEAPRLLTPMAERIKLLAATGIDAVVILPFDEALAGLAAREFARSILVEALGIRSVHEGRNFRFGRRAEAGVLELKELGCEFGFALHLHEAARTHGMEISSSTTRALVAQGDVRRARWMLGRPFAMRSTPARGRGIGTSLLVPTVNLAPYSELLPGFGVYVTRLTVGAGRYNSRTFQAVTNVGNRPTFGEASFAVESHILDFEPVDLDEETPVELEFLLRLRGELRWPSPEALKAQILLDVARAKRYFRLVGF